MGGNKITFEAVPESTNNVRVLGSLLFDKRNELGSGALLDLTGITMHQTLARDCIAALYEHASPDRIASGLSFGSYNTSIRELLDYCHNSAAVPNDVRMKDIDFEFLLGYRAHLKLALVEFKSEIRRRRFGNLLRLLQAGQAAGLTHSDFMPPRNFAFVDDGDITQPYTAGEGLDFEDASRTHIREVIARLERGKELLRVGINPKGLKPARNPVDGRIIKMADCDRPWIQPQNLLWYVVHVMKGRYLKRSELLAGGHSSFNNSMMGVWGGVYRKKDLYSHLYPLAEDLIPFILLLAKKTGRNESSILSLQRDCLQEVDGRYFLWYQKARGSARLYKKVIDNIGQFSPVSLIRTLQQITEPLVRHTSPEDREKLFLGLTIDTSYGSEPVKSPDPSYIKYQMNREGGWCDQRELLDEHGRPLRVSLRRWRVFYLTNRYKKTGQLSKVSRDAAHTLGRTTVGYVNNESTKHLHERAVEAGIQCARSLSRPMVVVHDDPQAAAKLLGTDEAAATRILEGKQDVIFASCKDFYNRPGGQPNTRCDKPWLCFLCPNAIITRHVLPRVVAFRDFMLKQRDELISADWNAKFGESWHVLTHDVLPKFSPEAIAEAERLARDAVLYIPLALKV